MSRTSEIETRLREAFSPDHLEVHDDSESHRGHAGFQEGGESHFHVVIRSSRFEGLSRIARHRAVHKALGEDLVGQIHALSMDLATP
ncbi:BolA family transcriptional regulator [Roseivivax marinus]|uniref:BolA family protein n=1 Tax=Roseivivax marinus TaxID=1379903 RepID=UPI0004AFDBEA|nr:BolA family protein [Roseivivax marinus]UMA65771.1 BolA family transcriptional regulator [Roseivivax marinus]SEL17265.1 BolA protein [Roseivivax marinus]